MMYTMETFKVEGEMYICLLDSFLDILLHLNYPHGVHSWSTSDVFWALNLCPVFSSWVVLPCCIQLLHESCDIGSYLLQLCGSWNALLVVLQLVAVLVLLVMERRLVVLEWFEYGWLHVYQIHQHQMIHYCFELMFELMKNRFRFWSNHWIFEHEWVWY